MKTGATWQHPSHPDEYVISQVFEPGREIHKRVAFLAEPGGDGVSRVIVYADDRVSGRVFEAKVQQPDLAGQQGTYLGDFNPGPFKGLDSLNPVLVCTPWLFWECFRGLDDEAFLQVAEAGTFYVLASVVLDHLVDGQSGTPGLLAVYHQALYNRGIDGYRATFPGASPFWEHYDRLAEEHLSGLAAEIAVPSVGLGEDCRMESSHLTGFALALDNKIIHMCIFARTQDRIAGSGVSRMVRYSRRRQNRVY